MQKMLHGLVLIMALLFIHACGGGGGSSSTSDSLFIANPSKDIKKIDISDKEKTLLTKENILELFKMSGSYIPTDLEFSRYEYDVLLSKSAKKTQECSDGGSSTLVTDSQDNQLAFKFNECNTGTITINGIINIKFVQRTENGEVGYYRGKNLTFTDGTNTYTYNYNIKFNNGNSVASKEYYIDVYHVEKQERTKINMNIDFIEENMKITGTYLLNDNTYFTLESKNLQSPSKPLLSIADTYLFDKALEYYTQKGQINLYGKNSELLYKKVNSSFIYQLSQNDKVFYRLKNRFTWTEDSTDLFSNEYTPNLGLTFSKAFIAESDYNMVLDKNQTVSVKVTDNDDFGNHKLLLTLVSKPSESQLSIVDQEISLNPLSEDWYNITLEGKVNIVFDKSGKYKFKVKVLDGDYIEEKEFSFDYQKNISFEDSNYTKLSGELSSDILYISSINSTAFLNKENKELLFIDGSSNYSTVSLPLEPSNMTFIQNTNTLAISADAKVFIVDYSTKTIINQYSIPAVLGDVVVYNNYLYTLEKDTSWGNLYSLNLTTGSINALRTYARSLTISLNPILNSLYIIDGDDDSSIDKYDISNGNATKFYNSPYYSDYDFFDNLWYLSSSKLLTGSGITLSMSNTQSHDMLYQGASEIVSLEKNKYNHFLEKIVSYDLNLDQSKFLLVRTDKESKKYASIESDNHMLNQIELHNSSDNSLVFQKVLPQYYQDEFGVAYRCFVENAVFIGNNRILVLYEANSYDPSSSWSSTVEDKFNFYQVIDIP